MKRVITGWFACLWFVALPAAAQQPLASVKAGQQVRITDVAGNHVSGRVDLLTADTVTVAGRVLTSAQIAKIERKGDSLWNGVAIGGALGLLLPLLPTEACSNQSRGGCIASGIETGALLGLAFDAIHRGYTTIYRAAHGNREDQGTGSQTKEQTNREKRKSFFVSGSLRFFVPPCDAVPSSPSVTLQSYRCPWVVGRFSPGALLPASRSFQFMIALKPSV